MPKKTLVLLSALIALTAVLVAVSLLQKKASPQPLSIVNQAPPSQQLPSPTKTQPTSTLSLSPALLSASSQPSQVAVLIDAGGQNATAAQIELSFDPKKITSVDIAAPKTAPFFDNALVLKKKIDVEKGRVSFAIGINPTANPKTGSGTVAILSFRTNLLAGEQTTIQFLPQSLVTAIGVSESILKSTSGTTITGSNTKSQ